MIKKHSRDAKFKIGWVCLHYDEVIDFFHSTFSKFVNCIFGNFFIAEHLIPISALESFFNKVIGLYAFRPATLLKEAPTQVFLISKNSNSYLKTGESGPTALR